MIIWQALKEAMVKLFLQLLWLCLKTQAGIKSTTTMDKYHNGEGTQAVSS